MKITDRVGEVRRRMQERSMSGAQVLHSRVRDYCADPNRGMTYGNFSGDPDFGTDEKRVTRSNVYLAHLPLPLHEVLTTVPLQSPDKTQYDQVVTPNMYELRGGYNKSTERAALLIRRYGIFAEDPRSYEQILLKTDGVIVEFDHLNNSARYGTRIMSQGRLDQNGQVCGTFEGEQIDSKEPAGVLSDIARSAGILLYSLS